MDKRGQMKISFGMIFSIILIILFISFAFIAIKQFLSLQDSITAGKLVDKIQDEVDKLWKGSQGSQSLELSVPSKVEKICFIDYYKKESGNDLELYRELKQLFYENENMFFYPIGSGQGLDAKIVKHLDVANSTFTDNPLCLPNEDGKVKIVLKKNYGESLVRVVRP